MASTLIESAQIPIGDELTQANILIENDKIKKITKLKPTSRTDRTINADGLLALPGMIDAHVHLRDLELSYKETFETGTQAAAVGGFTTVLDMPNTRPPTTSALNLAEKMSRAQGRIYSNVAFQGSLVSDSAELRRMAETGAIAFKLYLNKSLEVFDTSDQTNLTNALQAAKENNALVTVHAEDGEAIRKVQQESLARGKDSVRDVLKAHSDMVEVSAVRKILGLSSQSGVRVHICHITIPESVKLVRRTPNATCEASAHHLLLNQSVFREFGTLAICVPPIRTEKDRSGLWRLFSRGEVDILASDHAPHRLEEKITANAWQAASGIPGLETSLPLMFTQLANGRLTLRRLVEATATLPAKIFHLRRKGEIKEGYDADIVLVDPKERFRVEPENFLSKAKFSPFKGIQCVGRAAYTIVNGTVVAERGKIVGPPAGRITKSESA
ncbi:MAG: dihydroorotase [Candidatus Bathyarchaeia archaeon]